MDENNNKNNQLLKLKTNKTLKNKNYLNINNEEKTNDSTLNNLISNNENNKFLQKINF